MRCFSRNVQLDRRGFNGREDLRIASASTQVSAQADADRVQFRVLVAFEQRLGRHDHAGRAEPALHATCLQQVALEGVHLGTIHHPLDRGDLAALRLHGEIAARVHGLPIEQHHACTPQSSPPLGDRCEGVSSRTEYIHPSIGADIFGSPGGSSPGRRCRARRDPVDIEFIAGGHRAAPIPRERLTVRRHSRILPVVLGEAAPFGTLEIGKCVGGDHLDRRECTVDRRNRLGGRPIASTARRRMIGDA